MVNVRPFDLSLLERFAVPRKQFVEGDKIFHEEDPGREMFLVITGRVNIVAYGTILEAVRPNGIFGEMSLIEEAPRSAAAVAMEPTELAVINEATFLRLVSEEPAFSLFVMRRLAHRIRRMNESL